MHHYITTLYHLGVREDVVHLWRDYIPQQALEHPFLMHGLLAHAALHLAYIRPARSSKYLQTCDKHQAIALRKFRSILSSPVDPKLADALFALAGTLSVSSMARSCARSETSTLDMDAITELFILTRGVKNVIHLSYEHIKSGPLAVMLETQGHPEGTDDHLPVTISSRFEAIRHMLGAYGMDDEALRHCQFALTELQKIYNNIAYISVTANIEVGDVSRWQVLVPMGYIKLIQARSPPALIILAYYAATITTIRTAWYTQTWAECALRGIGEVLDGEMLEWMRWPTQQIQDRLCELGVRSPSEESNYLTPLVDV